MAPNTRPNSTSTTTNWSADVPMKPVFKKEVLCDGWYYDVTEFSERHPGGKIIEYYTKSGEDATHAIQQFHHRSSAKVNAILKSFRRRPATDSEVHEDPEKVRRHKALTEDFTKLYIELEREGFFKPSYTHILYRFVEILVLGYLSYILVCSKSFLVQIIGCVSLAMTQGRSGWLMHEGGHYSLTGKPKLDKLIQSITMGLFLGLSPTWWSSGHSKHHAMANRLHRDGDLETNPLLVYNVKVLDNPKEGKTFLIKYQKYLFPMIDTLVGLFIWRFYQHPRHIIKRGYYFQFVPIVAYYVLAYQYGFWPWLVSNWLVSIYMFGNFSLSHTHLPVTNEAMHWVEYAFMHSANIEPSWWCDWWMSYLNYQIEHHLFPTMPQFRQSKITYRTKAFAKKHGLPYYIFSYKEAVYRTLQNLEDVAHEFEEMED